CYDLKSVHRGVKRLSKQMHDRYSMEKKMAKILRQDELHKNGQEFDITALDSAVRANRSESSKMMRLITDLRKNQNRRAEELRLKKTKKGQNRIKTGQKQEAWRSPKESKVVSVDSGRTTEENAKRRAVNANIFKLKRRKKRTKD
nr:hypothetical protein [Tanacetum cinerariifolium]